MIGGVYYSMSEIGVAISETNVYSFILNVMVIRSVDADKEKNHPGKISACNGGCYFKNV